MDKIHTSTLNINSSNINLTDIFTKVDLLSSDIIQYKIKQDTLSKQQSELIKKVNNERERQLNLRNKLNNLTNSENEKIKIISKLQVNTSQLEKLTSFAKNTISNIEKTQTELQHNLSELNKKLNARKAEETKIDIGIQSNITKLNSIKTDMNAT